MTRKIGRWRRKWVKRADRRCFPHFSAPFDLQQQEVCNGNCFILSQNYLALVVPWPPHPPPPYSDHVKKTTRTTGPMPLLYLSISHSLNSLSFVFDFLLLFLSYLEINVFFSYQTYVLSSKDECTPHLLNFICSLTVSSTAEVVMFVIKLLSVCVCLWVGETD